MDRIDQENAIVKFLKELDDNKVIELHNNYCEKNSYFDDCIYQMGELDEILSGKTPTEVIDALASGFNTSDDYFTYGIYGVSSFDSISDCNSLDYDKLAEYVIDNESLEELFDEDELKEAFLDIVVDESNEARTKERFEKAFDEYDDYFCFCYSFDDDWSELEEELIEIIDEKNDDEDEDDE